MNKLEKQLSILEKKEKQRLKEVQELKDKIEQLSKSQQNLEELNKKYQEQILRLESLQKEILRQKNFLEDDRNNLVEQLKQQHEFILAIDNLQQKSAFNKIRVIQELNITKTELLNSQQLITQIQSENAELKSFFHQLKEENSQLNNKLQYYQNNENEIKQTYQKLLLERDNILLQLKERIKQCELFNKKQIDEVKLKQIEQEESEETVEYSISHEKNKQKFNDLEQTITNLKLQIIEYQEKNKDLQQKILKYQEDQGNSKSLFTQQQINNVLPNFIQQKIEQLKQIRQIIPHITQKVTNVEIKNFQVVHLQKENENLQNQVSKLIEEQKSLKNKFDKQNEKCQQLKQQLSQVATENWEIKNQLIAIWEEDEVISFIENLKGKLDFSDYPFDSVEELITQYNKMKNYHINQAEKKHNQNF